VRKPLALLLLVIGLLASYSWRFAPDAAEADVWNIATHSHVLVLLVLVAGAAQSREVWWVVGLVAVWQVLPALCSLWWLIAPWPVQPNDERCSKRLGVPLGLIGLGVAVWLAGAIYRERGHGP